MGTQFHHYCYVEVTFQLHSESAANAATVGAKCGQKLVSKLSEAGRSGSFRCCKFSVPARCKTGYVGVIRFLEPLAKDKKSNLDGNRREITSLEEVGGSASRPHPTLSAAVRQKTAERKS